jgi:hypothetical protein
MPVDGIEYSTTLTVTGSDEARNNSAPQVYTVLIDTAAPTFTNTAVTALVNGLNTTVTFATGNVYDGDTVASVVALLVTPSSAVVRVPATVSGADWSADYAFTEEGTHQILLVGTDSAGNRVGVYSGQFMVVGTPTALSAGSIATAPAFSLLPALTVVALIGAVATVWLLRRRRYW